jgi:alpha-glucosidase
MIDLSNPAARNWIKDVIRANVIGAGASGWMADYGEALPYDAALQSGEPAASYHNRYPEEWARLNREVIKEAGGDQMVFFSRSGYRHSPAHTTLFWLGDQLVSWDRFDGIKTAVTGLLSSGLSGFSLNHSDIGGHTAVNSPIKNYHRSKELLLRWMELNAFTAIYRTHEGNRPDENHQFFSDSESLAHYSRFAKIYAAWAFYRKELVREAAASGLPVVRHPFIHYPDDPKVYGLSYEQFMVGSEFMVAPVLDPGADTVSAYLPAGKWVHLWSGETYAASDTGLTVTVDAPLGQPGVFYKEGSPMGECFVENLQEAGLLAADQEASS